MPIYKHHADLANERFQLAEEQFKDENFHTASHLYINASINYHNALCQKHLAKIPRHKKHSDTSYFRDLIRFIGDDFQKYKESYEFLIAHKNRADYGTELSINIAKQIMRKAKTLKEISEHLL